MNESELAAGLPETPGYRYADVVGDQLLVAGQVPTNGEGAIVSVGDVSGQAEKCLENLQAVIEANGFAVSDIHRLVIYAVGEHQNVLDTWTAVKGWFGDEVPPATLLGVNLLGFGEQLVEIDATVVRQG